MNIHDPQFSSAQVARAAGMKDATFRFHMRKGNWRIVGGERSGQERKRNGVAHLFTIFDALGYALARELVESGVETSVAFQQALMWSHVDLCGGLLNDPEALLTLYAYRPDRQDGDIIKYTASGICNSDIPIGVEERRIILINLTAIRDRVFNALGLDARDFEDKGEPKTDPGWGRPPIKRGEAD